MPERRNLQREHGCLGEFGQISCTEIETVFSIELSISDFESLSSECSGLTARAVATV
jgi:hypothetical protein